MSIDKKVGEVTDFAIRFVKADGTDATGIVTDAPPAWSDTNPSLEPIEIAADGLSASAVATAAGTDTVKVDLMVGGLPYSATVDVNISAVVPPPPAFDHIEIVAA